MSPVGGKKRTADGDGGKVDRKRLAASSPDISGQTTEDASSASALPEGSCGQMVPATPDLGGSATASTPSPAKGGGEASPLVNKSSASLGGDATCCKCGRDLCAGDIGSLSSSGRSKQPVHKRCAAAYKRRMRQNTKNKQLKMLWEAMTVEEMQAWFKKHTVDELQDDTVDDKLDHTLETVDETARDINIINRGIPYSVFKTEGEQKGWGQAKIDQEWNSMLLNDQFKKVRFKGEVLVMRFMGIDMVDRTTSATSSRVGTKAEISSKEDLKQAQAKAKSVLNEAKAHYLQASQSSWSSGWGSAPLEVPDTLLQGLVADDILEPEAPDTLNLMFLDFFERDERRQRLLDQLLQADLVEASIHAASASLASTEPKETTVDLARLRIGKAGEFPKATETLELSCQALQAEIDGAIDASKGKIDEDRADTKETLAALAQAKGSLATLQSEFKTKVDELKGKFDAAESCEDVRATLALLKESKAEKAKAQQPLRRALSLLKALIKKKEQIELKGMKGLAQEDSMANEASSNHLLLQHFLNKVLLNHPSVHMDKFTGGDTFDHLKPQFVSSAVLTTVEASVQFVPVLATWLANQLGQKDIVSVALEKPKHSEQLSAVLGKALGKSAFERPHSVLHQWLGSVFAITLQRATQKFTSSGFFPYALGHFFVPLRHGALFIGLLADEAPGSSFADKVDHMVRMGPDEMERRIASSGFAAKAEPGTAVYVPPGYLVTCVSLGDTLLLKWAVMSAIPSSNTPELRRVLACTTSMISSYPALSAQYRDWTTYLGVHSQGSQEGSTSTT